MSRLKLGFGRAGENLGIQVLYMMQLSKTKVIQLFGAETGQEEYRKGKSQTSLELQSDATQVSSSEQASMANNLATENSK